MPEFVSLLPTGLPEDFDMDVLSEKPVVTVEEWEDSIEVDYAFPGFTVSDVEQDVDDQALPFSEVGISGAGFVSESGKPLMPSFGRFVQIPPGCDYQVSVMKSKPVEHEDILITPAQENAMDRAEALEEFEYDVDAYKKDALYPKDIVEVSDPQNVDDYNALLVHVRPLQYNAAKRRLVGYGNIKVTIKLTPKEEIDEADMEEYALSDP